MRWKKSWLRVFVARSQRKELRVRGKGEGHETSPCKDAASGKSLKLTGNSGENCFSQSPKKASNSSPSGRASKSMSCRIW